MHELKALSVWLSVREKMGAETKLLFISERRTMLSRKTAWLAIRQYGEAAELDIAPTPTMHRHTCGFSLADQGADTRFILVIVIFSTLCATPRPIQRGLRSYGCDC